ncbi:MAG: hypothetical protein A3G93_00665 [Nitrospinae bacterium RIFCSPLOWO2_12_FULL_45_22]|nr:MAG: hypothetical protein A3G93_00665 [Nitrospinae bacterium RIFCSPLOWO2_12_FULL_45_22]
MSQKDFLGRLLAKLDEVGIPYMISGSLGSSLHGEPRATNDIDLIIAPTLEQLNAFTQSLGEGYYISPEVAQEAFQNRSMFNVIDHQTGWKADLIICKDRAFSHEEFMRRLSANILGIEVYVLSPEDAILSKLEWSRESGSELQFRDALGVAVVQWERLDREYLRKWARELGVEALLETILRGAEELQLPE